MREIRARRAFAGFAAITFIFALAVGGATPAEAAPKSKRSQGKFVSYDVATSTVTIKEKGKEQVYKVKPEGTVLTKTVVKINGKGAKLEELPEGAAVNVYWKNDEADPKQRFARTIDAPNIDQDLDDGSFD